VNEAYGNDEDDGMESNNKIAFIDVEYGHDGLEERNLPMTSSAADGTMRKCLGNGNWSEEEFHRDRLGTR
jgi:hypothetical protein